MKKIIKVGGAPLQVGGGGSNVASVGYGLGEALLGITPEEGVICCSNRFVGVISNGFWGG